MIYVRLIRPFLHWLSIIAVFFIVYQIRKHTDLIPFVHLKIPYINLKETIIFSLISASFFIILWFLFNLYELRKPIHWYYKKFFKVWFLWFVLISFIAYFWYGYIFKNWISRLILFWSWIFSFFVILLIDIVINSINSYFEKKRPYKILILYRKNEDFNKIKSYFENYDIYQVEWRKILDFKDLVSKNKINLISLPFDEYDVIITVWKWDRDDLQILSDWIRLKDKKLYYIDEWIFLEDLIYFPSRLWPILAFEYKHSPLEWRWRVIKRVFDIIFSLIFILCFWWLYIIVAFFIYLKDWRPIIYKSKRVWRWGKIFDMYKFRTMVKNADKLKEKLLDRNERKWPLFKITNDPRIPKWWRFLRKTSLDEIPQFFNVLKWDMSVVWPRPHLPEEVEKYAWWQKRLLSVKPWITWYAQIFWRDKLDFDEEAKLDLYYIQNWSIFLDLYVIFMTLKVIFSWR